MQRRLLLLFLLLICAQTISAQDHVPTIRASSPVADIKVGDDFFAKGGWRLEPHKDPDIFSIGSKWNYKNKKVTFTTDLDSISFNVQPGNKYDFIVLFNDTPCRIRIVTLPNPVFMDPEIIVPILTAFAVILIFLFLTRRHLNIRLLLGAGYVAVILFWGTVFTSGSMQDSYNHLKDTISELGALGTRAEVITSASFIVIGVLSLLFSVGFYMASRSLNLPAIPAVLSFSKPVTLAWAAIFPLWNEFHSLTGPLPLLIAVASLLAFIMWRRKEFTPLRMISLFSFLVMMLILLRFKKPFGHDYEGLVQRFFYFGWSAWTIAVSFYLSRAIKDVSVSKK